MQYKDQSNTKKDRKNDPIYQQLKKQQIACMIIMFLIGAAFQIPAIPFVVRSHSFFLYPMLLFVPVLLAASGFFVFEMVYAFYPKRKR